MRPIWSKDGQKGADAEIQAFLAGEDILLDQHLILFDIEASAAHASGLHQCGILSVGELNALTEGLSQLRHQIVAGDYVLGPPHEDGHSAIEAWLTENVGPVGGKIHTGRSRNDQVQTATRLYLKDRLRQLQEINSSIASVALDRAEAMSDWIMPGYTHLQRAVPSTVGLWLAAFAEAFIDNADLASLTRDWLDSSPLGTAAGYGVNLDLPRESTKDAMGFSRLQINPMYAQNSRGRFELQALGTLAQSTLELRRLAWDLSLFTSQEYALVNLDDRYTTGSSIMPNKRNPDTVELLRARHAVVAGAMTELQEVLSLPSGYQRDLQATKPPVLRAMEQGLAALRLIPDLLRTLKVDRDRAEAMVDPSMFATDVAIEAAVAGIPFREAYRSAMKQDSGSRAARDSVSARTSAGGCANLMLDALRIRLDKVSAEIG